MVSGKGDKDKSSAILGVCSGFEGQVVDMCMALQGLVSPPAAHPLQTSSV